MIESLKALLAEWKETRGITLEFINKLSDADLDNGIEKPSSDFIDGFFMR